LNKKIIKIFCEHTSPLNKNRTLFYHKIRNYILKKGDMTISLNKKDFDFYVSQGVNNVLIYNGISFKEKNNYNLHSEFKNIVFVGRFSHEKDPIEALHLFKESQLWNEGYKMTFYGYGPLENILEKKVLQLGLKDKVFIITDENNRDVIYKDKSLLIMTSKYEGFGMVLVEAMSRGIPCIAY